MCLRQVAHWLPHLNIAKYMTHEAAIFLLLYILRKKLFQEKLYCIFVHDLLQMALQDIKTRC
jgi:hypothetical protein